MLLIYSHGNHLIYRRLVNYHYLFFTAGCGLCSPIAFGFYELYGFASAFYGTAIYACAVGALLATYYACRLANTPDGPFGSLAVAEKHLKENHDLLSKSKRVA